MELQQHKEPLGEGFHPALSPHHNPFGTTSRQRAYQNSMDTRRFWRASPLLRGMVYIANRRRHL